MVLQQLQGLLAGIYDLPVDYDVYDFLFTERERLPLPVRDTDTDEQVLVLNESDGAAVGLFLDAELLQRLAEDVTELGFVESAPKQDGRNMIMVLGPHKKKADAKVAETIAGISEDMLQELGSKIASCPKTILSLCQLSY